MSAAVELQTAIYTAITGNAPLMAAVDAVYDDVPDNTNTFPYVTIGEDVLNQWDTDGHLGFDASVTIHVWSRYRGRREVKQIQKLIYDVLHNGALVYSTFDGIMCQQRSAESFADPDGLTRHGVQVFNVLMQKQ